MSEPKFKVGDQLRHVAGDDRDRIFVVEVLVQTCPGGTQIHYTGRLLHRGIPSTELIRFNEIELVAAEPIASFERGWGSFKDWVKSTEESHGQGSDVKAR